MTFHVHLFMVPGDETFATWNTDILILSKFLFGCFLVMNPFSNRAKCYGFGNKVDGPFVKFFSAFLISTKLYLIQCNVSHARMALPEGLEDFSNWVV